MLNRKKGGKRNTGGGERSRRREGQRDRDEKGIQRNTRKKKWKASFLHKRVFEQQNMRRNP